MAATTEPGPAAFPVPPLAARLFDLARAEGYEARIVGGAVRDWLAGLPIGDIDMAVAAPIDAFADACRPETWQEAAIAQHAERIFFHPLRGISGKTQSA